MQLRAKKGKITEEFSPEREIKSVMTAWNKFIALAQ
jgi:hypothetical protein